ncbi:hypothetical protein [Pseudoalteromonas sp. NSLLW218]|uniref:hypothetical protein n=1 Tax=Pseudoalteromonas sp. NSLLW218 TaxID=2792048 RepID=UPI0018CF8EC7|nr:hypothetical protein [Pseudoalteromonas sp. NSLLW218]MBH0089523.1 hypothetical protein [Pseudoalteromonas sp. NSLLW218]
MHAQKVKISLSLIVLILLFLTTAILLVLYAKEVFEQKWAPIVGGMAISSLVSLVQYLISYKNYRNNEKLEDSGVLEFLSTRGDRRYYSQLINKADAQFDLLFHTSKRFFEDFCEEQPEDNLLIKKLDNNPKLIVRMLLTHRDYLESEEQPSYDISERAIKRLTDKYSERFQVKFYKHEPNHNLFITDKDAVIGPYFKNERGKYLPSIHFRSNASFVAPYKKFFDTEWNNAESFD